MKNHTRPLVLFAVLVAVFLHWYPTYIDRMSIRQERMLLVLADITATTKSYSTDDSRGWNELYQNTANETVREGILKITIEQALVEAIEKGHAAEKARAEELKRFQNGP